MRPMPRVRVIHWKPEEAVPLLEVLREAGFEAECQPLTGGSVLTDLRRVQPDALVIDLSRLPSHGREVGVHVRASKSLRAIPLIYVGGAAEKVAAIRALLPDAVYTSVAGAGSAVRSALHDRVASPVVPKIDYSGRTVAEKLGIKAGSTVAAVDAPSGYPRMLGPLPAPVEFDETGDVTLWFVHDADGLRAALPQMRKLAGETKLWVLWQKQSKVRAMNQNFVRESALATGLVDYKICSVSEAWSAIALAVPRRKSATKSAT